MFSYVKFKQICQFDNYNHVCDWTHLINHNHSFVNLFCNIFVFNVIFLAEGVRLSYPVKRTKLEKKQQFNFDNLHCFGLIDLILLCRILSRGNKLILMTSILQINLLFATSSNPTCQKSINQIATLTNPWQTVDILSCPIII